MKDITNHLTLLAHAYPADALHPARLLLSSVHSRIVETFRFKQAGADEKQGTIQFGMGEFETDGTAYLIEALAFEERRIAIKFHGPSPMAEACMDAILKLLGELDIGPTMAPFVVTSDAAFSAVLDFDFEEIFVPAVRRFIDRTVPNAVAVGDSSVSVTPRTFSLQVLYHPKNAEVMERSVTMGGRRLVIEPRMQTSLKERRYFCSGPVSTEALIGLVEDLETSLIQTRAH